MLPPPPLRREPAAPFAPCSDHHVPMHSAPAADAMELRRCVVEAANASTALMLASARAAAANSQLLSVAMPVGSAPGRCSSRASSASRQSSRASQQQQQRVCYEQWAAVVVYWLEQLELLQCESVGSMLMRFMWISRSNLGVAATFGLLNDAYRGRRLQGFLEAVVKEVNAQPGMIQRGVQIDCNLQKVHPDAHRRQGGARVSSQSMPVLAVLPSMDASSSLAPAAKSPDQDSLRYAWQELARVARSMRVEFQATTASRRRRQAMFGKPWTYRAEDAASDAWCDGASVASWGDERSAAPTALLEETDLVYGASGGPNLHSEC